jgi:hypothetical protein
MSINDIDIKNILDLNIYDIREYIKLLDLYNKNDNDKLTIFLKNISDKILYKFYQLHFPEKYIKFITPNDIKKIILNNNDNHISYQYFDTILERIERINNSKYKDFIYNIYDTDIYNIIKMPISPLEEIFLNIDDYKLDQLINDWGIIVPNKYTNNIQTYTNYIINDLLSYKEVIERNQNSKNFKKISLDKLSKLENSEIRKYLLKLTDKEIFKLIGVYINFDNRIDLINNIITMLNIPRFMLPLKLENTENLMLAYGTLLSYKFVSLENLYEFWSDGIKNIQLDNQEIIINTETLINLKYLLKNIDVNYPNDQYKITILNNIDEFIFGNS